MLTADQKRDVRAMLAGVEPALRRRRNADIIDAASAASVSGEWAWNGHSEHVSNVACRAFRLRRRAILAGETRRYRLRPDVEPLSIEEQSGRAAEDRFGPSPDRIVTVWSWWHPFAAGSFESDPDGECFSGISGGHPVAEWVHKVSEVGHAITTVRADGPTRGHRYFSHDDAEFCESRAGAGSQAAYYETATPFDGPWWESERLAEWRELDAAASR